MDSKGKIREWSISVGKDKRGHYYEITHGQKDGAMQNARTYVLKGKNIGRANETTAEEQCLSEAKSEHTKQIERKGYTESIPTTQPLKPMLAKKYEDEKDKVIYPCAVQPKLDGACCLAHITKDGVTLVSRSLTEFRGLDHISDELKHLHKKFGNIILHGELFNPELSFQTIMSLVRKTENLTDESKSIQFWVYDMVSTKTFKERSASIKEIIEGLTHSIYTPTHTAKSESDIVKFHKEFTGDGFEGTMVRNLDSSYKINSRSSDLLKYKDFDDDEFRIVGYKNGSGKFENVPTFDMVTKEGYRFEGVPTGTEEERAKYLENAKYYLGTLATVRYFGYTTTSEPVPRFPVIIQLDRGGY